MTKEVADILRRNRRRVLNASQEADRQAEHHEKEAARLREEATQSRYLHCQLGASIQVLEGDHAALDLPDEIPFPPIFIEIERHVESKKEGQGTHRQGEG